MNSNEPIHVCVVEDHNEIRNGLIFVISNFPGYYCSAHKTGEEALTAFKQKRPDVVLMDINLPGMNGIECTRKVKEKYPDVLIMMCTVFEESEKIFDALKAGASGYILKRKATETLLDSIKDLLAGGAPMSSDIARKVVNSFSQREPRKAEHEELTDKENEILGLLASGYTSKEIATRLFVSVNTVRTHVYRIYDKLHVHNRVEAINKLKKKDSGT